ncbi:MAG: EamA family transporter [Candidatus Rokuibacteriota bacterium]|nr:MAG: EamA family transporter [Candidatus Rokubacteria bacterium]
MAILNALIAALAFGLSAPLAKRLLDVVPPLFLAGLLYLGAGVFLGLARRFWPRRPASGRPLTARDRWILAGVVLTGGLLAPPLLLWGLARSSAMTTALLLNLEVVFTVLLAGIVFKEHLGARIAVAATVMAAGGVVLGWTPGDPASAAGAAAVAGACLLWALDNNLTRLIAETDPLLLVEVKGLVAGMVNIVLAIAAGQAPPSPGTIASGLALGAVSYGTSLVLFILAMRELGAARAGAYFATAPFFGAAGGLLLLGESPTVGLLGAAALMALAAWLLVHERHVHRHVHPTGSHAHVHVHDEHHQHAHAGWEGSEPHSHPHPTGPMEHEHPHTPDIHHDHGHG